MTSEEAAVAVIDILEVLAIPYIVVGSLSSNYYGIPRSTKDADFVVALEQGAVRTIADRLGSAFRLDPQLTFETVTMSTRFIIHVAEVPFTIELFLLSEDAHDRLRFQRRVRVEVLGRQAWLPTPEDVIITKLRWASRQTRSKDWDDVRDVIAVQGTRLNWEYIYPWTDRHGTRQLVDEIRASIPVTD